MQAEHYTQIIATGKISIFFYSNKIPTLHFADEFKYFDYGPKINLEKYGKKYPPFFHIKNFTAPVALLYGRDDLFVRPKVSGSKFSS